MPVSCMHVCSMFKQKLAQLSVSSSDSNGQQRGADTAGVDLILKSC